MTPKERALRIWNDSATLGYEETLEFLEKHVREGEEDAERRVRQHAKVVISEERESIAAHLDEAAAVAEKHAVVITPDGLRHLAQWVRERGK